MIGPMFKEEEGKEGEGVGYNNTSVANPVWYINSDGGDFGRGVESDWTLLAARTGRLRGLAPR